MEEQETVVRGASRWTTDDTPPISSPTLFPVHNGGVLASSGSVLRSTPVTILITAVFGWALWRWVNKLRIEQLRGQQALRRRRKYGIPDSDTRPFEVAHAAAQEAQRAVRRRIQEQQQPVQTKPLPQPVHMIPVLASYGITQPEPVPLPSAEQGGGPHWSSGNGQPQPASQQQMDTLGSHTASESRYGPQSDTNRSLVGPKRDSIGGPPKSISLRSLLRPEGEKLNNKSHLNGSVNGYGSLSKSSHKRSILDEEDEEDFKTAQGVKIENVSSDFEGMDQDEEENEEDIEEPLASDMDEDEIYEQKRGSKRRAPSSDDEDFGERKRARHHTSRRQRDDSSILNGDLTMDSGEDAVVSHKYGDLRQLIAANRGRKRLRSEGGSEFGDLAANAYRIHVRKRNKYEPSTLMEDIEGSPAASVGTGSSSKRTKSRKSRMSNVSSPLVLLQDVGMDGEEVSTDPLCQGRAVGQEWEIAGRRYKVGPNGNRLRLVPLKTKQRKYNMPADSNHPDANVEIDVIVETWLGEDEYQLARDRGDLGWQVNETPVQTPARIPSQTLVFPKQVTDMDKENQPVAASSVIPSTPSKGGKHLYWDERRRVGSNASIPNPDNFDRSRTNSLGKSTLMGAQGFPNMTSTPYTFAPLTPKGRNAMIQRAGPRSSLSKWEKQEAEAKALMKLRRGEETTVPTMTVAAVPSTILTPKPPVPLFGQTNDSAKPESTSAVPAAIPKPPVPLFGATDPPKINVPAVPAITVTTPSTTLTESVPKPSLGIGLGFPASLPTASTAPPTLGNLSTAPPSAAPIPSTTAATAAPAATPASTTLFSGFSAPAIKPADASATSATSATAATAAPTGTEAKPTFSFGKPPASAAPVAPTGSLFGTTASAPQISTPQGSLFGSGATTTVNTASTPAFPTAVPSATPKPTFSFGTAPAASTTTASGTSDKPQAPSLFGNMTSGSGNTTNLFGASKPAEGTTSGVGSSLLSRLADPTNPASTTPAAPTIPTTNAPSLFGGFSGASASKPPSTDATKPAATTNSLFGGGGFPSFGASATKQDSATSITNKPGAIFGGFSATSAKPAETDNKPVTSSNAFGTTFGGFGGFGKSPSTASANTTASNGFGSAASFAPSTTFGNQTTSSSTSSVQFGATTSAPIFGANATSTAPKVTFGGTTSGAPTPTTTAPSFTFGGGGATFGANPGTPTINAQGERKTSVPPTNRPIAGLKKLRTRTPPVGGGGTPPVSAGTVAPTFSFGAAAIAASKPNESGTPTSNPTPLFGGGGTPNSFGLTFGQTQN